MQFDCSIQISRFGEMVAMPGPIQFNREMSLGAEKIHDPLTNRNLPAEFQTALVFDRAAATRGASRAGSIFFENGELVAPRET